MSGFQPGDAVIVYLPEPFRRTRPTGVVQDVASYTVEGEAVYDLLMDDGEHPREITVRGRYIETFGVFTVPAAQEAAEQ